MFVSFEGLDGCGKSTQARLAAELLQAAGREVVLTREPGGTDLGEEVRSLLLHGGAMVPWAEAALYAASRAQLAAEVIRPALARGAAVLSDRYLDSSLVYQGVARGLGVESVLDLNLRVTGGLLPDRTFLLLLDPREAARRKGAVRDRIESERAGFHASVDTAYRELAATYPQRIVALDADRPVQSLAEEIGEHLRALARAA